MNEIGKTFGLLAILTTIFALGCAAQPAALQAPSATPTVSTAPVQAQQVVPAPAPTAPPAPAITAAPAQDQQTPATTTEATGPAPSATTASAAPACEQPPAVKKPRPVCPVNPEVHSAGPYWTERPLEPAPFICPSHSYPEKVVRKFGRGLANVITAPVELINQPLNAISRTETGGVVPCTTAFMVGIPMGVGWTLYRALAGVWDIVTFPLPFFKPIIKPEFVTSDFQRRQVLEIKSPEEIKQRLEPQPR